MASSLMMDVLFTMHWGWNKMRGRLFLLFVLMLFLAAVVSAMKNPAAVYCTALGYDYKINENALGQEGFCVLPDGSEVEGWAFLRGDAGKEYSYCVKEGYEMRTVNDSMKCAPVSLYTCGVCVLKTGDEVEVTRMMRLNFSDNYVPKDLISDGKKDISGTEEIENNQGQENSALIFIFIGGMLVLALVIGVIYFMIGKSKTQPSYIKKRAEYNGPSIMRRI